jgi:hypothetical protein
MKTRRFACAIARCAEHLARNLSAKVFRSTNIASAVRQWRRLLKKIENKESNMLNKLLAAAAMAAIAYATCPANAAKMSAGCSGENLGKTESTVETMADGDAKIAAQKEISAAQDAMLAGKMGACAAHLGKAMHAVGAK